MAYDFNAKTWNMIINAVNDGTGPGKLEGEELELFNKLQKEKEETEKKTGIPCVFENIEKEWD